MYDVITVGSATVDVFAMTQAELITIRTANAKEDLIAYPSGSKILINGLDFKVGGGGTNTAVSFSRMGLKTAYIGELGKDDNAKSVLSFLKKEKIDFLGNFTTKEQTGYSIVLDSIAHDRTILVNKGANNFLSFSNLKKTKIKSKWFYFSSMMGKSLNSLHKLSVFGKKNNINIAFNPSIYQIKEKENITKKIIKNVDVLIYNKEEAQALCHTNDINKQLKLSHNLGAKIVIITDGANGCHASDTINYYFLKASKLKVIESTGAGDAFASGFISSLSKNKSIEASLKFGIVNAESVIQHIGAKPGLLKYKEAINRINKNKYKVITKNI